VQMSERLAANVANRPTSRSNRRGTLVRSI
jgi:hypothetical protein